MQLTASFVSTPVMLFVERFSNKQGVLNTDTKAKNRYPRLFTFAGPSLIFFN
jgi:hypothetical protein